MSKFSNVRIVVHKEFFDKVFEPSRRKLEKQLGLPNLSQSKFTQYLSRDFQKPFRRKRKGGSIFDI